MTITKNLAIARPRNNNNDENKVFAQGYCFWKIFIFFMLGCFLGVVYERIISYFKFGVVQPRVGVIYGPFNPVYGAGIAVFIVLLGKDVKKLKWHLCYIYCTLIGGVVEYITSFLAEKVFHMQAWNYDYLPLNINGRTSVGVMLLWGLFGTILVKVIYPVVSKFIEKIPYKIGTVLVSATLVFMIFNGAVSITASLRQVERKEGTPPQSAIDRICDKYYPDEFLSNIYQNVIMINE